MSFRELCDKAYDIMVKFQHIGLAEMRYELNVNEAQFRQVVNWLVENKSIVQHHYDSYAFITPFCKLHKRCLWTQDENTKEIEHQKKAKELVR